MTEVGPGRARHDLRHRHRRHRSLGRLDPRPDRHPARRVLAECRPAAARRHGRWRIVCRHASRASSMASSSPASSVPPLIATLATLALYRGLAEGISQARSVRGYPGMVLRPRPGRVARRADPALDPRSSAPSSPPSSSACTTFGRATYAIGSNETAARFSGIRVDRDQAADLYGRRASSPALAAVIFVSRVSTTRSDMGTGLELDVDHRRGARRHQHLRRPRHHHRHRARPHSDPGPEERPRACRASRATAPSS